MHRFFTSTLLCLGLAGNVLAQATIPPSVSLQTPAVTQALEAIRPHGIEAHMTFLADDLLRGRQPGTEGFALASRYMESQFKALGLTPAGEEGTYLQAVPLRKAEVVEAGCAMQVIPKKGEPVVFTYDEEYLVSPDLAATASEVTAPVVFVGFGVTAPELRHDDYAKLDVSGKIVAMLSGAPASFPSDQRAYYSSTKLENAVAHGAVGVINLSSRDSPRSWDSMVRRTKQGAFRWLDAEGQPNRTHPELKAVVSVSSAGAAALFADLPKSKSLDKVLSAEVPPRFALPVTCTIRTQSRHTLIPSNNVVGLLPGSDPDLKDEYVVYVAHFDHFGVGVAVDGDSIYNGAHDNASGSAILLEVARGFAALPTPPRRSILFLAVTAEEWGLLGSDYFASNPTVPQENLVATIAMDMPFLFLPLLDIVPYGADHSSIATAVGQAADFLQLGISPDPMPEQVLFIRSDHFSFIRQGIPALFVKAGSQTDDPAIDGKQVNLDWRGQVYHTPKDDMTQAFDFEAGAKHARLDFLTGYLMAQETPRPTWNAGDFFGGKFGQRRPE
ncbi:Zn-dependent amino-or carboxypeptidase, M28 family [Catalinimonas alkaloidigena]|uniref:Zn-dependent amino-or carboxypeptidase, M28 family n=1 Tax=Catalinimonas alkaloidigena TaxID=1075417 RepID=A0A1G8YIB5_9BACT|nr:M28 family metallopeptidase [Catalinimonas alkaloidigena]SDK01925.1 Zn-dependent amino-or carboxypeptidase, M28 family [Catalinimonas alkaloidigena]